MVTAFVDSVDALYADQTSASSLGNDSVDQQDFLTLLVAQLQNQDPLNPVENQEFVSELATFSSLEEQQKQTDLLQQLIDSQSSNTTTQALSLIGKEVSVESSDFTLQEGEGVNFTITASQLGSEAVQILDSSGKVVRSDVLNVTATGEINYYFDGTNNQGETLPSGEYTISAGQTMDEDGNVTEDTVSIRGYVEGVTFVDGSPILVINGNAVPISQVNGVYEGSGAS